MRKMKLLSVRRPPADSRLFRPVLPVVAAVHLTGWLLHDPNARHTAKPEPVRAKSRWLGDAPSYQLLRGCAEHELMVMYIDLPPNAIYDNSAGIHGMADAWGGQVLEREQFHSERPSGDGVHDHNDQAR